MLGVNKSPQPLKEKLLCGSYHGTGQSGLSLF